MKIYTEIQYKWLDDQLVKTSSKSFEYYGSLSLCVGSGGGGLPGPVGDVVDAAINDDLGSAVEDVASDVATTTTDVVESASNVVEDVAETTTDVVAPVVDKAGDGLEFATDITEQTLEGTSDLLTDTVGSINTEQFQIGGTTKDLLDKAQDTVGGALDGLTTSINDGLEALTGGGPGGENVELEKMKSRKGKLKNKNTANLKVNKSKGRARKSLRIG